MIKKITLESEIVSLEPVSEQDVDAIWQAAKFPEIWKFMPVRVESREDIAVLVKRAIRLHESGDGLSFVIREKSSREIVGSTSYLNTDLNNLRTEIGMTWITPRWQRTAVNTSCKFLVLKHGFEELGLNRIELKTDSLNVRSQTAMKRIGATEEGTLRKHVIQPDGRLRHTVYFSILKEEWPTIKENLLRMIATGPKIE